MITTQTKNKAILVVEDSESVQDAIQNVLQSFDCPYYSASNGKEALEILKQHPNEISSVLLDMFMPVMDGWQLLEALKSDDAIMAIPPIVIMSAAGDIAKETAKNYQGYLRKPIELDELIALVQKYSVH